MTLKAASREKRDAQISSRGIAAKVLFTVLVKNRSLDTALANSDISDSDRPLIRELVTGCVRHYYSLKESITGHLNKPLRPKDMDITCILLLGAYQLVHTRIPSYAAVNEAVACVKRLQKPWAAKLVNAVLRNLQRQPWKPRGEEAVYDHPQWFIEQLRKHYPTRYKTLLAVNNTRAPMCLRINASKLTREDVRMTLQNNGIDSRPGVTEYALVLDKPVAVTSLPGYSGGAFAVQDQGAQLISGLLQPQSHARILDACAAPGGKTFDLLARYPGIRVTALEKDPTRLARISSEGSRLQLLPHKTVLGDATRLDWWDGETFDQVLLDAPCSGSGTLRRHPDIKLLKHRADLGRYHDLQLRLMQSVWQTLKAGGTLLYCTCSVFPEENDHVVGDFLRHLGLGTCRIQRIATEWGTATTLGRQLLPETDAADGFYFARIEKTG